MRFNIANKAPIVVTIAGTEYKLPPVTRRFWVEWASGIDAARMEAATANLEPLQKAKMLMVYPVEPVGHAELTRRIYTPDGTGRIIRESATKAGVPKQQIDDLLENGDGRDLETLALMLAGIADPAEIRQAAASQPEGEGSAEGESPLASSPAESNASSETT